MSAKRRGNNEGSWKKRPNGTWEYRVSLGRSADGELIRKSIYGKTKAICLEKYDELAKSNFIVTDKRMRVGEWADAWLATYKEGSVGSSTYTQYSILINNYIKPSPIGGMLVSDVKPVQIQALVQGIQHMSHSYVSKLKATLWSIFDAAIDNDLCVKNPCATVRIKSQKKRATEEKYFTVEEVEAILESCRKSPSTMSIGIYILAYSGMRRGELLGLQWNDIDFKRNKISIRRVVYLDKNTKMIKDTAKSEAGIRVIPLLPKLKEYLESAPHKSDFIVPDSHGDFYNPKNFSTAYKAFIRSVNGVRELGTHAYRHALATHLHAAGVDIRTIQAILGHTDITVTGNVYISVDEDALKAAMGKLPY